MKNAGEHERRTVTYETADAGVLTDSVYCLHEHGVIIFVDGLPDRRMLIPWHRVYDIDYNVHDTNFDLVREFAGI